MLIDKKTVNPYWVLMAQLREKEKQKRKARKHEHKKN